MWQAIVLQDDAALLVFEEPGDGAAYRQLAAEVFVPEEGFHLAWPIDGGRDGAGLRDPFGLAVTVGARPVGGDVEPRRTGRADGREDFGGYVGPVEDQEQNRGTGCSWEVGHLMMRRGQSGHLSRNWKNTVFIHLAMMSYS